MPVRPGALHENKQEVYERLGWKQEGAGEEEGKGVGLKGKREVEVSIALERVTPGGITPTICLETFNAPF